MMSQEGLCCSVPQSRTKALDFACSWRITLAVAWVFQRLSSLKAVVVLLSPSDLFAVQQPCCFSQLVPPCLIVSVLLVSFFQGLW